MPAIPCHYSAFRPFAVWFVARDGTSLRSEAPLRVGDALATYDDALALAEATAEDLPSYGMCQGLVLVLWKASTLRILRTLRVPACTTGSPDSA